MESTVCTTVLIASSAFRECPWITTSLTLLSSLSHIGSVFDEMFMNVETFSTTVDFRGVHTRLCAHLSLPHIPLPCSAPPSLDKKRLWSWNTKEQLWISPAPCNYFEIDYRHVPTFHWMSVMFWLDQISSGYNMKIWISNLVRRFFHCKTRVSTFFILKRQARTTFNKITSRTTAMKTNKTHASHRKWCQAYKKICNR